MNNESTIAREIAAMNDTAMDAFRRKDAAAIAESFVPDGQFLGSHQPVAIGRPAIRAAWQALMSLPNVTATWGSVQVVTAKSRELTYEIGTYRLAFDGDKGRVSDVGKYIVIWRKEGERWMIVADMINSDLPAAS